jgi:hypothetical protein
MTKSKYNVQNLTSWRSAWRTGPTKTVRIPSALEREVMDYARKLDVGETLKDDSSLEQLLKTVLSDPAVTRGGKDRGSCRRALNAFVMRLKQC